VTAGLQSIAPSDWIILFLVAGARLALPLAIPRFPLPAILAALLLDGVDQSIFQQFTDLPLAGYQGYDKALDIYYLTIAYISTLCNWQNRFALQVSRFLFYWRLAGVALFEITQARWLLPIFANTFEYFFIFYEAFRLRWDPRRLNRKALLGAAAAIWIVIKLPQEYWLHIAQLDATDWIKTELLGLPVSTPWSEILAARWPLVIIFVSALALALWAGWRWLVPRLPPADHPLALDAEAQRPRFTTAQVRRAVESEARQIVDAALLEKVLLISLVSVSFAHVLPGVGASDLQLALVLGLVVTLNTALTHLLARRRFGWAFTLRQFVIVGALNAALALLYVTLRSALGHATSLGNALFFALLITLLITLFDRYRQVYLMRFENGTPGPPLGQN
jgi:hypothetical protein